MKKEEPIKCIKSATWNLAWKDYRNWTVFIIVISLMFLIPFFTSFFNDFSEITTFFESSFFSLYFFIIIFVIYHSFLNGKARRKFMMEFAAINELDYKEELPPGSFRGSIFDFGHSQKVSHVISGNYNNQNIRLFNYQTKTGYGRYQRIHYFTIFELFFEKVEFPLIVLQTKRRWSDIFRFAFKKNIKEIKLESEFEKNFILFCTEGYAIEALQIFKPETLRLLKEKGLKFNIEMTDNRLYIYESALISTRNQLYELYEIAQTVIDSLGPLLNRLSNDFEVLHKYYKKCARIKK